MTDSPILVHVTRGPLIESRHRGQIVLMQADGTRIAGAGDSRIRIFARSSAKPLQAVAVVESGAADHYALSAEELALLCASHNGEETHVKTARALLGRLGLDENALQCGVHAPYHKPSAARLAACGIEAGPLHNNCSGKHTGMLAMALHIGAPVETYLLPEHFVQRRMLETITALCAMETEDVTLGTDGCGVPVFGMPLDRLALGFARFGAPEQLGTARAEACRRVLSAIRQAPYYLAGTDRFDTVLAEATAGRIIGKMGAEGVFAMTVPERCWGIALKIEDGSSRALYPAAVEALIQLKLLSVREQAHLERFHCPDVRNWEGTAVGRIEPSFRLA